MMRKNNLHKIYWIRCIGLHRLYLLLHACSVLNTRGEEVLLQISLSTEAILCSSCWHINCVGVSRFKYQIQSFLHKYFLARAHERLIRYCLTQLKNKYLFFRWATMQYIPQPLLTSLVLLVNSIGNEIFLRCTSSTICRVDCFLSFNRNYYNIVWRISSGSIVPSWGNKAEVDLLLHQRQVDA